MLRKVELSSTSATNSSFVAHIAIQATTCNETNFQDQAGKILKIQNLAGTILKIQDNHCAGTVLNFQDFSGTFLDF